jgi:hypothetical protein
LSHLITRTPATRLSTLSWFPILSLVLPGHHSLFRPILGLF